MIHLSGVGGEIVSLDLRILFAFGDHFFVNRSLKKQKYFIHKIKIFEES